MSSFCSSHRCLSTVFRRPSEARRGHMHIHFWHPHTCHTPESPEAQELYGGAKHVCVPLGGRCLSYATALDKISCHLNVKPLDALSDKRRRKTLHPLAPSTPFLLQYAFTAFPFPAELSLGLSPAGLSRLPPRSNKHGIGISVKRRRLQHFSLSAKEALCSHPFGDPVRPIF